MVLLVSVNYVRVTIRLQKSRTCNILHVRYDYWKGVTRSEIPARPMNR